MKWIAICLLFITTGFNVSYGQQTRKTDDALLVEYYQAQRWAEAFNYLRTVYTEPLTDAKEIARLAYTASMASKLPDAESYYQRIYERDTTDKTSIYNMAAISSRRGNNTRAEFYFQKYILKDSSSFSVYKQLASIRLSKGDIAGQIVYLQKANQIDTTEFDVASDLSDRYVTLKLLPKAEKVLSGALSADPENIVLLQSLLKLLSAQKKWDKAIKTGEQLRQLGDDTSPTLTKLGIAYYEAKNYRCGIETLLGMPETLQTEISAYYTAACYKQLKDHKNAVVYFDKAVLLSKSSSTGAYYGEMGDSYDSLQQYKKALTAFQQGLLYNEDPLTYYLIANLYDVKMKDTKAALKYFKKYLAAKNMNADKQKEYLTYSKSRVEQITGDKTAAR